jgi:calcium/calmodulin-dependent protein kinase I
VKDTAGAPADLLPNVKKNFNAKKLCMFFFFFFFFLKLIINSFFYIGRKAAFSIRAVNRMATLAHVEHDGKAQMREDIFKYKEESAKVSCCRFSVYLVL